ncbi:MAG: DNA-binding protein [Thalassospira sp.]|nr:DNA-binding protein [Thalassospira sp.]
MLSEALVTVKGLVENVTVLTESMVRWWIYNAAENGFDKVLIKIGGRVFIDMVEFNSWLEIHRIGK